MIAFLFLAIELPIFGSIPSMWDQYSKSIDQEKGTFQCFSQNHTIPLSKINDNFLDCSDGSDEPGTSIFFKGQFYCKNEGSIPKIIRSWSVNDGICDCCDGSDELFNPHINCPNTCNPVLKKKSVSNKINNNSQMKSDNLIASKSSYKLPKINFIREFFISIWKNDI